MRYKNSQQLVTGESTTKNEALLKRELLKYSKKLSENKFVIGPGGNTSCKIGEFLFIKPSGLTFEEMEEDDFVKVRLEDGFIPQDQKRTKPSSEILMHRYIYMKRPDVTHIFHAHPPITIGIAAANIKFGHIYPDDVAYLGKDILVLDYIVPTTHVLAEYVRDKLGEQNTIVLNNHGAITLGTNSKTTYLRMELLESLAQILWIASSSSRNGEINYLTDKQIDEILNLDAEKYRTKLFEPGNS